ncbi:MAG TPA: substrate-binding domain-containing protein, partial [Baekduia sp.]|nr:substrate-binding domain-containing protein [Baekduia sp.]
MKSRSLIAVISAGALAIGVAACGNSDDSSSNGGSAVSGAIAIDGSSTVYPFTQAAAEQFQTENPDARVTVGESGTGGGFEKFCKGETDVSNASRPIKDEEKELCKKGGISFSEVQVANDGIAVVTNKNLAISCLTTDQLKQLWNSKSTVKTYNQLDSKVPDTKVSLYGPGTDSGTFDFFTGEING